MSYGVVVPNKIRATDIDALNRVAVCAAAINNGYVFELLTQVSSATNAEQGEVWNATQSAGTITNMWMAYSPEITKIVAANGSVYKGLDNDPRNFRSEIGDLIDCFRPMVGDIITITSDSLYGTKASASYTHVVATSGYYQLVWATGAVSGLSLAWISTGTLSIPTGTISDTQQVTAYKFQVVAVS
jgi:hypothetical protein